MIFLSDDIPGVGDFTPVTEDYLNWKTEQDLKDIGKDAQPGLRDTARKGAHPGGYLPRGYKAERALIGTKRIAKLCYALRWTPNPATTHLAPKAWVMWAAGASYLEVQGATGLCELHNSSTTFISSRTYVGEIRERLEERGIAVELTSAAREWLAKEGYDPAFGVRPLRRTLQRYVESPLSKRILRGEFEAGDHVLVDVGATEGLDFAKQEPIPVELPLPVEETENAEA